MAGGVAKFPARFGAVQGGDMLQPDEVTAMVRLHGLGRSCSPVASSCATPARAWPTIPCVTGGGIGLSIEPTGPGW
jgi:hypothetical protein